MVQAVSLHDGGDSGPGLDEIVNVRGARDSAIREEAQSQQYLAIYYGRNGCFPRSAILVPRIRPLVAPFVCLDYTGEGLIYWFIRLFLISARPRITSANHTSIASGCRCNLLLFIVLQE